MTTGPPGKPHVSNGSLEGMVSSRCWGILQGTIPCLSQGEGLCVQPCCGACVPLAGPLKKKLYTIKHFWTDALLLDAPEWLYTSMTPSEPGPTLGSTCTQTLYLYTHTHTHHFAHIPYPQHIIWFLLISSEGFWLNWPGNASDSLGWFRCCLFLVLLQQRLDPSCSQLRSPQRPAHSEIMK